MEMKHEAGTGCSRTEWVSGGPDRGKWLRGGVLEAGRNGPGGGGAVVKALVSA